MVPRKFDVMQSNWKDISELPHMKRSWRIPWMFGNRDQSYIFYLWLTTGYFSALEICLWWFQSSLMWWILKIGTATVVCDQRPCIWNLFFLDFGTIQCVKSPHWDGIDFIQISLNGMGWGIIFRIPIASANIKLTERLTQN